MSDDIRHKLHVPEHFPAMRISVEPEHFIYGETDALNHLREMLLKNTQYKRGHKDGWTAAKDDMPGKSRPWMVSELLAGIAELDEEDTEMLLHSLDHGMHCEWDCGLDKWWETGFGPTEFKIAAKSAVHTAKEYEKVRDENNSER
jgi:hypothetical protein